MVLSSTPVRRKLCVDCGQDKLETEFRRRSRNSDKRHSQCRDSYNAYMRQYRANARRKEIAKFACKVSSPRVRPNAIPALVDRMFRRFGGVDGFCTAWTDTFKAARAARPGSTGSKMVLDWYRTFFRLMELTAAEKEKKSEYVEAMSDEEADSTLVEYVRRALDQREPPFGALSMRACGRSVSNHRIGLRRQRASFAPSVDFADPAFCAGVIPGSERANPAGSPFLSSPVSEQKVVLLYYREPAGPEQQSGPTAWVDRDLVLPAVRVTAVNQVSLAV
jgi:hypothetical protein